jgi:fatty acid/phospholipid biosynthesis enzyme
MIEARLAGMKSIGVTKHGNTHEQAVEGAVEKLKTSLDSKTDKRLTKNYVSRLLEEYNLSFVDLTDINGMTYFCSRNNR